MSEENPAIPQEQISQANSGNTLVIDRPDIGLGDNYETNIPDGVNIFAEVDPEYTSKRPYEAVNPGKLDELPGGEYFIRGEDPTKEENYLTETTNKVDKNFNIVLYGDGKYLSERHQIGNLHPSMGEESKPLLEKVGFVFSEEGTLIPTPLTVQKKMRESGVEVELFENTGLIPPAEYVRSYRDGKYPIATGEEFYYEHDISDDHITGVLLGGDTLRDALSETLAPKFAEDGSPLVSAEELGRLAEGLDRFTQTLRAIVSPSSVTLGEAYGLERGKITLATYGDRLGLNSETIAQVLEAAQQKARDLDIPINDLK